MTEYTALMYVPAVRPRTCTREKGAVVSYAKNVFIMEDCRELMPEHLHFIRGLVDSSDISLNVSPEMWTGPNHCIHAKGAHEEMVKLFGDPEERQGRV